MKGDRVEIVVDTGGAPLTYHVSATRAGRRVETSIGRGVVEVAEVTRGGTVVRTARFMSSRVLALVEHPVPRRQDTDEAQRRNGARPDGPGGAGGPDAAGGSGALAGPGRPDGRESGV